MIWLKKALLYHLSGELHWEDPVLVGLFERMKSLPIADFEPSAMGWVSPVQPEGSLYLRHDHCLLVMLRLQKRSIPASALQHAIRERLVVAEAEGQIVSQRLRREIKDQLLHEMMPKAFVEYVDVPIWLDFKDGLLWVGCQTEKVADEATSFLRKTLGDIDIRVSDRPKVITRLTAAARDNSLPAGMELGQQVWLGHPADTKQRAQFSGQELPDPRVDYALSQGMWVQRLALVFQEAIQFNVNDRLNIAAMRYLTSWRQEQDMPETQNPEEAVMADMVLLLPLYRAFGQTLLDWLGAAHES